MKDNKLRYATLLQLVENAQDGIVVAEKEGTDTILIYVNPAFERLTGFHGDDILYQDCRFLQGDETDAASVKRIREAIDAQVPIREVLKNYRKDGSYFWNELSITPFHDEVDNLTYFIGIQKDVTAQIELQKQLEASQQELKTLKEQMGKSA